MPKAEKITELRSMYVKHEPIRVHFHKPSRTKQEFKNDCDINQILKRFSRTGVVPGTIKKPAFLDCTTIPNLQDALHLMKDAEHAFMKLPAVVRKHFDNNAIAFVDYALDPKNIDQLREWNIVPPKPEEPKPQRVEVVNADKSKEQ